jgi:CRP-like cAMP-binding protein
LEALHHIPFLSSCTTKQLARIDGLGTPIDVRPGRTLTREGMPGRECFVTLGGVAVAERAGRTIGWIRPGSIAGEMALLAHTNRTATVTACTSMRLLVLSDREFETLLEIAPEVDESVRRIAAARHTVLVELPGNQRLVTSSCA